MPLRPLTLSATLLLALSGCGAGETAATAGEAAATAEIGIGARLAIRIDLAAVELPALHLVTEDLVGVVHLGKTRRGLGVTVLLALLGTGTRVAVPILVQQVIDRLKALDTFALLARTGFMELPRVATPAPADLVLTPAAAGPSDRPRAASSCWRPMWCRLRWPNRSRWTKHTKTIDAVAGEMQ